MSQPSTIDVAEKIDSKPQTSVVKEEKKSIVPPFVDELIALAIGSEEFQRR